MNANSNQPATAKAAKTNQDKATAKRFDTIAFYSQDNKSNHPDGYDVRDRNDGSVVESFETQENASERAKELNAAMDCWFIAKAVNEHAALIAVAEAANEITYRLAGFDREKTGTELVYRKLRKSLANLAAIRSQNGGGK